MTEVHFITSIKRRLKSLAKRYRQSQRDIQPILENLQTGNFVGDKIPGISMTAFKVRAKNSAVSVGKSGGY
ncbi:hypothetical protein [Acaryochloris thomasi]|uniref:hypothetical protein n=1 Tax=Acaryochloris thomasi TaxID=2929456 RepID=UPI001F2E5C8F|nr:hypothetical protein [Acaryochloris thomasi]